MAFAVVRLKLRIAEFWSLLPREFFALSQEFGKAVKEEIDTMVMQEERADWRMGSVCAVTANCHRSKGRVFKPSDFMPEKKVVKKDMTSQEMLEEAKKITIMMGGEVKI